MSEVRRQERNEKLANDLKGLMQIRIAQEDAARYESQIADLEKELHNHRYNLVLRGYLSEQLRILKEKYNQKCKFVQEQLFQYTYTYSRIPNDIWDSARKLDFFVDDVVMGRAYTLEDAIECARIRNETDPFWYTFDE